MANESKINLFCNRLARRLSFTGVIFFTLIWSAFVLAFDAFSGSALWHQFASRYYPSTTGRITRSEVTGRKAYGAEIHYRYQVNGHAFDGARLRYSPDSSSQERATRFVNQYPVGSEAQVYFNPKDPADSLLLPGWDGLDIYGLLFLMPFNMVALGLWASLAGLLRERLFRPVAGGVIIIADGVRTRIRLPQSSAFLWGMVGAGAAAFASTFIVGFFSALDPSIGFSATFLFLSIGSGIGAYGWQCRKIRSGDDDLIINEASGEIALPKTYGRKQRMTVNVSEIAGIMVKVIEHRNSKGGASYTYAPILQMRHAEGHKIADWSDEMKADAFSEWLRKKLGLKALNLENRFS